MQPTEPPALRPRDPPLLEVLGLSVNLAAKGIAIVSNAALSIAPGECVALVGESGSGKSMLAFAVAGLLPDGVTAEGTIRLDGQDLLMLPASRRRALGGAAIGFIFQEPMSALHPLLSIGEQIVRPMRHHLGISAAEARSRATEMLERVGVPPSRNILAAHVHELSGGLRQRVMIGMALSCRPRLVIADEPTTALDATLQTQILDLLRQLRHEQNLGMLLISHDLGLVAEYSDRVAIMYAGEIVEQRPTRALLDDPSHPYALGLIDSIPDPRVHIERLPTIPGAVPALDSRPGGCRFRPRCRFATAACEAPPPLLPNGPDGTVLCIHPLEAGHVRG